MRVTGAWLVTLPCLDSFKNKVLEGLLELESIETSFVVLFKHGVLLNCLVCLDTYFFESKLWLVKEFDSKCL